MFTKELSSKLLKILNERNMTLEGLADASNLSSRFISNITNEKQIPTLESFEKICSALEVTPNDLLISEKSMQEKKSKPMPVSKIHCCKNAEGYTYTAICPSCDKPLASDWQSYCDRCGQRLSWEQYPLARIVVK